MTFPIPDKEKNPVCEECVKLTPHKATSCQNPCSHLVSWASHQATADIVAMAIKSARAIRESRG